MSDKSLYGQYIAEREGKDILEDHRGFATYSYAKDGVYVQDIYVAPDYRRTKVAWEMLDKIAQIAIDKGFLRMYGSCCPSAHGSTESLKAALAYGFKLDSSSNNFIVYVKDLG